MLRRSDLYFSNQEKKMLEVFGSTEMEMQQVKFSKFKKNSWKIHQ
jgi:hypothetical protein